MMEGLAFRALHCPGAPPLSPAWMSFFTFSRSLGSVYLSFAGILVAEARESSRVGVDFVATCFNGWCVRGYLELDNKLRWRDKGNRVVIQLLCKIR